MIRFELLAHEAVTRGHQAQPEVVRVQEDAMIEAMMQQADPVSVVRNFATLADVVKDTMTTDIPIDALPSIYDA